MTAPVQPPPPADPVSRPSIAIAALRATSPALRYTLAGVLMTFSMGLGTLLVWYKQPLTWIDLALILPAFVLGFGLAAPGTLVLVVGVVKQVVPFGRRAE